MNTKVIAWDRPEALVFEHSTPETNIAVAARPVARVPLTPPKAVETGRVVTIPTKTTRARPSTARDRKSLTIAETAKILGVPKAQVLKAIERGHIVGRAVGDMTIVPTASLQRFLDREEELVAH